MRRRFLLIGIVLLQMVLWPGATHAVETAPRISDREIIERLSRLEEGQKRLETIMNQRFEEMEKRFDARFETVDQRFTSIDQRFDAVNQRFDAVDRRFEDMKWFLGTMIGVLMLLNSAVMGYLLKRQGATERSLETIRDEVIFLKTVVNKLLPVNPVL